MITDSFKQELLARVDIVDVINARVSLKKGGANWMACCPFHSEKTPSFTVSPSKQFYHCFGCGAHGNAIGFLMEYAGLGYIDALRELAQSVGMRLPEYEPRGQRAHPDAPDLAQYMRRAADYFRAQLKQTPRAIEYLKARGLTGRIAAHFGMGYAPDGWQNLEQVFTPYDDRALVECGLVVVNDAGRRYDRFRDRIVFPILDQRGAVIGFGGRVIGQGEPKYLNSPETPLFEKGRELYGLAQARQAIRRTNRVVVVEGYMDVVALAQHGVENAVATLGTATTPVHVRKLLMQADEVVFCFDGDAAGRRAAWHALEVSLEALSDRKAVKFLFLPAEHDPDTYVRALGKEAFERALSGAQPLSEVLLAHLRADGEPSTLEARSRVVAEAGPLLRRVAAPALQLQLVGALAGAVGMLPGEIGRLVGIRLPAASYARRGTGTPLRSAADARPERELLRCVLARPELAAQVDLEALDCGDGAEGRALCAVLERLHAEPTLTPALLCEHFRESEHRELIHALQGDVLYDDDAVADLERIFVDTRRIFAERRRRARFEELRAKISAGQASREEQYEYASLSTRSRDVAGLVSQADGPT